MAYFNQKQNIFILSLHRSCENSSYNLSRIERFLKNNQYEFVEDIASSDIVIINTCAYSDQMQLSTEKTIHENTEAYPEKTFLIFGCIVRLTHMSKLENMVFIENSELNKLSVLFTHTIPFESCHTNRLSHFTSYQDSITIKDNFIQICQGCRNHCSYCNIKMAKGAVRSKPIEQIEIEIRRLIRKNIFKITLLGDDCGSYGHDIGSNIAELMTTLKNMDSRLKFKIYTIFPALLLRYYPKLRPLFETKRITYVCLPLQSASRNVLKLMNRDYNPSLIKKMVEDIKTLSPHTHVFTHFIINFPGESLQDFTKSLELAKSFDSSLFLPYQENKRTRAYSLVPKGTSEMLFGKTNLLKYCINNRIINAALVTN